MKINALKVGFELQHEIFSVLEDYKGIKMGELDEYKGDIAYEISKTVLNLLKRNEIE
jgi:hypothetical protein